MASGGSETLTISPAITQKNSCSIGASSELIAIRWTGEINQNIMIYGWEQTIHGALTGISQTFCIVPVSFMNSCILARQIVQRLVCQGPVQIVFFFGRDAIFPDFRLSIHSIGQFVVRYGTQTR